MENMENVRLKMKKIDKPDESTDLSSFSCLPDDILLQILSRLIDLKPLCRCKLVSTRFNHTVRQVDAISVTITSVDHPNSESNSLGAPSKREHLRYLFKCDSFVSVMKSSQTFSALKSLCIEIPPFRKAAYDLGLFKWKFERSKHTDSFLFLSRNSVCDTKENVQGEEEDEQSSNMKLSIALGCLADAFTIKLEMLDYMKCFPLLENVTITDADKRGRVSFCGGIISDVLKKIRRFRWCYVPLLKLPVSGYMMKGVVLLQFKRSDLPGDDSSMNMNLNDSEDKEEAAYSEAVMEIFKKNSGWIEVTRS